MAPVVQEEHWVHHTGSMLVARIKLQLDIISQRLSDAYTKEKCFCFLSETSLGSAWLWRVVTVTACILILSVSVAICCTCLTYLLQYLFPFWLAYWTKSLTSHCKTHCKELANFRRQRRRVCNVVHSFVYLHNCKQILNKKFSWCWQRARRV